MPTGDFTIIIIEVMGRCFTVDPSFHCHKVGNKAWYGALEEGGIAQDYMLIQNLGFVVLGNH